MLQLVSTDGGWQITTEIQTGYKVVRKGHLQSPWDGEADHRHNLRFRRRHPSVSIPITHRQTEAMSGYRGTRRSNQNLSESKLKRVLEVNQRLREQLDLPRVKVSEASASWVAFLPISELTHNRPHMKHAETLKRFLFFFYLFFILFFFTLTYCWH